MPGPRILMSDWDAFSIGNGHNGYLIFDPRDGLWRLSPFDMDNSFGNASVNLYRTRIPRWPGSWPGRTPEDLLPRPGRDHRDGGYWTSTTSAPFLDAVATATGLGTAGIKSSWARRPQASGPRCSHPRPPSSGSSQRGNDITTQADRWT